LEIEMFSDPIKDLALTSLGHFINDGTVFFVPLIADIFASQKKVPPSEVTMIFVVFYGSSSILSAYVGRLADKTGRPGPLIGVGTMLLSLGMLGYFATLSYTTGSLFLVSMMVSAFLAGFGSGFYHPLGASVLQSSFRNTQRGRALGINGIGGSIGRAVYPGIFFLVAIYLTTYGSLAFFGVVGAMASIAIWLGLKSQRIRSATEGQLSKQMTKARDALTKGIVILTLVSFVRSVATSGIVSWIPIYISNQKGLGVTSALGLSLTIMFATAIVGQPFFGWLVDKFDRRVVLAISTAGAGLAILGYLFTSGSVELIVLAIFGFFTFTAFPLLLSLASDYEPEGSSSLGNALVWGIGISGGGVIGPLVTGTLVLNDYAQLGFAFEIMAVAALLSAVGAMLLPKSGISNKSRDSHLIG
jgi:FSR family fosmidomycin resistance protein-like MFS transporter